MTEPTEPTEGKKFNVVEWERILDRVADHITEILDERMNEEGPDFTTFSYITVCQADWREDVREGLDELGDGDWFSFVVDEYTLLEDDDHPNTEIIYQINFEKL